MSFVLGREEALLWCSRLVGLSVAVQSAEMLRLAREAFSEKGIWRWSVIRSDFSGLPTPVRMALDRALGWPGFAALLLIELSAAIGSVWVPCALSLGVLLVCALAVAWRFGGSFNGGSDSMTIAVLPALLLAHLLGSGSRGAGFALALVCAQSVLSYFVAGWVKVREKRWRSGEALQDYLLRSSYVVAAPLQKWIQSRRLALVFAWSVMLFELAFPLALSGATQAFAFVALAAAFHLGNYWALGLNRFFLAWAATWPAILHFASVGNRGGGL